MLATPANFFELIGKIITKITNEGDSIETSDGKRYRLIHHQDCCESVQHERTIGNPQDLIGHVITLAEDDTSGTDPSWYTSDSNYRDSYTWSIFILQAQDIRVEFYYLGESNGYYGETMSFEEITE